MCFESGRMGKQNNAYVVCAVLQGADTPCSELSEVMTGQSATRRLNRIERVALSYDGELVRRSNDGLLVAFDSASEAVLAACEMQRRSAALPPSSGTRLTLQIGIHKAAPESDTREFPAHSVDVPEKAGVERRNVNRRQGFDVAGLLAGSAPHDGIVLSGLILEHLGATAREISQPMRGFSITRIPAHSLDWQNARPRQIQAPVSNPASQRAAQKLVLRHGAKRLEIDRLDSVTTIGRDPGCDVAIADNFASRVHASIQLRADGCVLTDNSSNGTCVTLRSGMEILLKNESYTLTGRGYLSFGHAAHTEHGETFEFQVAESLPNSEKSPFL